MALTGTLVADFSDFLTAVKAAEVELHKFEGDAGKVSTSLNRMANSLNGTKMIQDATLMSEAVERIGGISKLTESELSRLSAQAKEAAAKMVLMGKDVPPGLQKIADATKLVHHELSSADEFVKIFAGDATKGMHGLGAGVKETAAAMTEAVTRMGGVSKLIESDQAKVNKVLTEAIAHYRTMGQQAPADMVKLAEATKSVTHSLSAADEFVKIFSGDATKGMHGLGVGVKETAAAMTEAVNRMGGANALIASDQAKVNKTLTEAIAHYRALGQEAPAGMLKLAEATRAANPPTSSLSSGISTINSLLGAFGVALSIGAVVNFGKHVFDAASQIHDMSEKLGISTDAVQGFKFAAEQSGSSLDAVGVAINKMNQNLAGGEKATIQALKDAGLGFDAIRSMKPEDAFLAISDAIQKIPDPMTQADVAMALFGKSAAELLPGIKEGFRGVADSASKMSKETIDSLEAAQDAWGKLANQVTIMSGSIIAHTMNAAAQTTQTWGHFLEFANNSLKYGVAVALTMADAQGQVAQQTAQAAAAVGAATPVVRTWTESHRAGTKAVKEHAAEVKAFTLSVQNAAYGLTEPMKRLGESIPISQFAQLPPVLSVSTGGLDAFWRASDKVAQGDFFKLPVKTKELTADFGDLSRALAQLAQISGGTFAGMVQGLASVVGALDAAQKGMEQFKTGKEAFSDGKTMAGILGMASGIMGITSAAIAAGRAIYNIFDRDKGRDAVEEFAKSFGGFDALHNELLKIGQAGEELWIKLTQGVGRNNPAQAARVIAEVEDALMKQKQAQDAASVSTEAGAQATIETASQAALALEDLNGRIKVNADVWGEWSEDVTGYLQKLANDIRSMPLPSPGSVSGGAPSGASYGFAPGEPAPGSYPSFASGTYGQYLNFGSGTLAMLHGRERVMTANEAGPREITIRTVVMTPDYKVLGEGIAKEMLS